MIIKTIMFRVAKRLKQLALAFLAVDALSVSPAAAKHGQAAVIASLRATIANVQAVLEAP